MVTMMTFRATAVLLNLRNTLHRAGYIARVQLIQNSKTCLLKRGQLLTQIPKVTLLCWGAVNASSCVARCQEAVLPSQTAKRKSLAKVQVHKVVFFLQLSIRAVVLLLKFGPLLLLSPLTLVSAHWASRWLDALLWMTETSGPTFIKLGQWASTRRDIFPPEFCECFSRLHVKVRPHSWAHTKQCLRRAFGESWKRVLVFESKEPVGSGCVAQVYRGWARADQVEDPAFQSLMEELEKKDLMEAWEIPGLQGVASSLRELWRGRREEEGCEEKSHPQGQQEDSSERLIPVAIKVSLIVESDNLTNVPIIVSRAFIHIFVTFCRRSAIIISVVSKVLHPGVRRQVEIDLLLMKAGSWLLHCLPGLKWLSLCEIVEEFEKLMTKQVGM